MNFLVTGGAGFIGSHVCERLLRSGHSVCALDDLNSFYTPALKRRNLEEIETLRDTFIVKEGNSQEGRHYVALERPGAFAFKEGDLTNSEALDKLFQEGHFDQVIHLAARAGVRPSLEQPALYQRVNVEGTANVLEAARRHGVKKLVLASSSSVYGVNKKVPFAESDPVFSVISPYAASKLACEGLGHVYHHVYGMDIAMLRFFTVYGPRQRPDLAIHKFARAIAAGKPIQVYGDGSTARDYTFISDIVDGIMACTERNFGYEIFNLGNSNTVTLSRLIELLEKSLNNKAIVQQMPEQPGDVPLTYADLSKSHRQLGYAPKVKIEEGIPRFVEWMKGQA